MQLPPRVALIGDIVPLRDEKVWYLLNLSYICKCLSNDLESLINCFFWGYRSVLCSIWHRFIMFTLLAFFQVSGSYASGILSCLVFLVVPNVGFVAVVQLLMSNYLNNNLKVLVSHRQLITPHLVGRNE